MVWERFNFLAKSVFYSKSILLSPKDCIHTKTGFKAIFSHVLKTMKKGDKHIKNLTSQYRTGNIWKQRGTTREIYSAEREKEI